MWKLRVTHGRYADRKVRRVHKTVHAATAAEAAQALAAFVAEVHESPPIGSKAGRDVTINEAVERFLTRAPDRGEGPRPWDGAELPGRPREVVRPGVRAPARRRCRRGCRMGTRRATADGMTVAPVAQVIGPGGINNGGWCGCTGSPTTSRITTRRWIRPWPSPRPRSGHQPDPAAGRHRRWPTTAGPPIRDGHDRGCLAPGSTRPRAGRRALRRAVDTDVALVTERYSHVRRPAGLVVLYGRANSRSYLDGGSHRHGRPSCGSVHLGLIGVAGPIRR